MLGFIICIICCFVLFIWNLYLLNERENLYTILNIYEELLDEDKLKKDNCDFWLGGDDDERNESDSI